jgi:hypothetical protein
MIVLHFFSFKGTTKKQGKPFYFSRQEFVNFATIFDSKVFKRSNFLEII